MLIDSIRGLINGTADLKSVLVRLLIVIPIVLVSLTVHEFAHGYVSLKCGDPTARNYGRLTLNPLKHLDPVGALCMLLFGFGWAKPVPINTRYYKKPRLDTALVSLAGPVSNVLLAFLCCIIYNCLRLIPYPTSSETAFNVLYVVQLLFYMGAYMNVYLGVFNLLPIPPLDGSKILYSFLPPKAYFTLLRYERYGMIVLLALLWFGIFDVPLQWLADGLINGMQWLIELIPIFR